MKNYRVYLKEHIGWREFGQDFTLSQAHRIRDRYVATFPSRTYVARKFRTTHHKKARRWQHKPYGATA